MVEIIAILAMGGVIAAVSAGVAYLVIYLFRNDGAD